MGRECVTVSLVLDSTLEQRCFHQLSTELDINTVSSEES